MEEHGALAQPAEALASYQHAIAACDAALALAPTEKQIRAFRDHLQERL